jgi:hypothetical protein
MRHEYWQIQCPHCCLIGYYRVANPVDRSLLPYRKWPILKCRCGKFFQKRESELCIHTCCDRINNPTSLQKRQAEDVWLEVKYGVP